MPQQRTESRPAVRAAAIQAQLAGLTPLDFRLLQWLLRYPLQRADDLVLGVARWASRATVYRHVAALQQAGLLETVQAPTPASGKHLYYLSNLGLQLYAAQVQQPAFVLAQRWQADEDGLLHLLPRLPTLLLLQDVVNGLVRHTANALTQQGRRPSLIEWNWQRDYRVPFSYREKPSRLFVDGVCTLCVRATLPAERQSEQWYSLLLLHSSLSDVRLLRLRLERILCWRECAQRWSCYQHMPLVLVLATSRRQGEGWQMAAEDAAQRLRLAPLAGAITCLPTEDDNAWQNPWLLPWRTLATDAVCHLQDLLRPMPLAAVPQLLSSPHTGEDADHDESTVTQAHGSVSPRRQRSSIIIGNFARRAARLSSLAENTEHEAVSLLALRVTPRLWSALHLLLAHPLLSMEELAALLHLQVRSMRCCIAVLHALDCIEPVRTEEEGVRWRLAGRGLRLLAAAAHCSVRTFSQVAEDETGEMVQRGQEWLLRHMQHTAGIYGFFAALSSAAYSQEEQALLWWETGAVCERRYQAQDRWYNLKPDALAEVQVGAQRLRFWLEWDRGTMNARDLSLKFGAYAHYISAREWARERSVLPLLLCVTTDIAQEKRIWRVAQARLSTVHGLGMYSTTAELLSAHGPLGAIWFQGMPARAQSAHASSLRQPLFERSTGSST